MKRAGIFLLFLFLLGHTRAQQNGPFRIAVFTPLYLDSAFDGTDSYRYNESFPKFINPGLEFYEGVHLAIDSLNKEGLPFEFFIYDSRSGKKSLNDQLNEVVQNKVELIIAHITGRELFQFTKVALENKIPLINVNLPNDGGITNNPYFVLLNTTMRTHCEEIYSFLQKKHATDRLVIYTRKGQMEDMIRKYFTEFASATTSAPLKLKFVELPAGFTTANLTASLDSTQKTVGIVASLDTSFSNSILNKLGTVAKSYKPLIIGMPTWDNQEFNRPEWKGMEIMFTTPFYNARTDKVSQAVLDLFTRQMYAKPSDMVIRGLETTYKFAHLLAKYRSDLSSNLASKEYSIIRTFDIQPVMNKSTLTLDYFENRKLYFVKWQDGVVKMVQ